MVCVQCGSQNHQQFLHNVNITQDDFPFISNSPIKNRNIKDVECNRCSICGCITINQKDLHNKIKAQLEGE